MKTYRPNKWGRIFTNILFVFLFLLFGFPLFIKFNVFYLIFFIIISVFLLEFYWNTKYSELIVTDEHLVFKSKSILGREEKMNRKVSWDKIEEIITLEGWTGYGSNIIVDKETWSCVIHGLTENYRHLIKEICDRATNATVDENTKIVIEKGVQLFGRKKYFFPKATSGKMVGSVLLLLLLYVIVKAFDYYADYFLDSVTPLTYHVVEFLLMIIVGMSFIPLWRK